MRTDLTNAPGSVAHGRAISIHVCANCKRAIHVGRERINHRPVVTSSFTDYYHPECCLLPEGTP